jgi:hypothetical protein
VTRARGIAYPRGLSPTRENLSRTITIGKGWTDGVKIRRVVAGVWVKMHIVPLRHNVKTAADRSGLSEDQMGKLERKDYTA